MLLTPFAGPSPYFHYLLHIYTHTQRHLFPLPPKPFNCALLLWLPAAAAIIDKKGRPITKSDSPTPISDDASTRPTNSPRRATHTPPTVQHRGSMGQSWRRPESEPRLGKLECWVERARNLNPQNIDVRREGREGGGQERRTAELRGGCSWSRSLGRVCFGVCVSVSVRAPALIVATDHHPSPPLPPLLPSLPGQVVEGWPNCSVFIVFSMKLSSGFRRKESSRNIVRG